MSDAKKLGISAVNDSMQLQMYGIGVVVDNVASVDHLNNQFTVTMKIYLSKIEPEHPPKVSCWFMHCIFLSYETNTKYINNYSFDQTVIERGIR